MHLLGWLPTPPLFYGMCVCSQPVCRHAGLVSWTADVALACLVGGAFFRLHGVSYERQPARWAFCWCRVRAKGPRATDCFCTGGDSCRRVPDRSLLWALRALHGEPSGSYTRPAHTPLVGRWAGVFFLAWEPLPPRLEAGRPPHPQTELVVEPAIRERHERHVDLGHSVGAGWAWITESKARGQL